jgi:Bacteriophage tail sheath protein
MPEYLAPGVYVEEKDSGPKAIEGVSTTTSGMVGVTERGPEGVPTLVIGFADFRRQFGGLLDRRVYTGANWYLPHAVEGFFTDGGKRLYVVRVLPVAATAAGVTLFDRGSGGMPTSLAAAVIAGDSSIMVSDASGLAAGDWLKIDDEEATEYVQVKSTVSSQFAARGAFQAAHADGAAAKKGTVATSGTADALNGAVNAGQDTITIGGTLSPPAGTIVQIGSGDTREYGVVDSTALQAITFKQKLANAHVTMEPVVVVTFTADTTLTPTKLDGAVAANATAFRVEDPTGFTADDVVEFIGATTDDTEYRVIDPARFIRLGAPAGHAHAIDATVKVAATNNVPARTLTADPVAGSKDIVLDDVTGLAVNTVLRLGDEVVTVHSVTGSTVTLDEEPAEEHKSGDAVLNVGGFSGTAALAAAIADGDDLLQVHDVNDLTGYHVGDVIELDGSTKEYRLLSALPSPVTIEAPLQSLHGAGVALVARSALVGVEAIDRGGWGNDLYVTIENDDPITDTYVNDDADGGDFALQMRTTVGVEVGSVLEIGYDTTTAELHLVSKVTSKGVELATALAASATKGMRVRTREFRVTVQLRQLNPSTNKLRTIEGEVHRRLSMNSLHSRYFAKVIGRIYVDEPTTPLQADGRTQGESDLIRVEDVLTEAAAATTLRLGPDLITDTLPDGRIVPVPSRLASGDDFISTITDDTYLGVDDLDPHLRLGLYALKNIEEISIVAIPGRTEQKVQQALLDHCELMRYRFAVLDARPGDSIADVKEHRSLYDSKYGALYHPWLTIDDPFPDNPRVIGQIAIPPSGHVIGIYARSDIERGVHKAPANEVVRGISGLVTKLAKEHQDILNPLNINVIRNFRESNRGLRVWGARTLTTDSDWKYINVRRLFIFLEHSIDRGTQWVVFEPNSELLWQRVRRVISSFLTAVWRDGALMGLKPEEAYFVKCDRTTMSQNDIDNGRLIVEIGVAPVKPAEFVIFRIGQWAGGSAVDEG